MDVNNGKESDKMQKINCYSINNCLTILKSMKTF